MNVGVSKILDCNIGVFGQPRYVEFEVSNMGKAISWAAVLPKGVECTAKPC